MDITLVYDRTTLLGLEKQSAVKLERIYLLANKLRAFSKKFRNNQLCQTRLSLIRKPKTPGRITLLSNINEYSYSTLFSPQMCCASKRASAYTNGERLSSIISSNAFCACFGLE